MSRVYDLLAPLLGVSTVIALFCVLVLLIKGRFHKYWIVFVYVLWELLATAGFTIADSLVKGTTATTAATRTVGQMWYARLYWANDVFVDLFRFVLVIVLLYRASEGIKRVPGRVLAGIVIVMVILPFVLFPMNPRTAPEDPFQLPYPSAAWFNSTSELLNFGAAIMNLMLWATLAASKKRDPQILGVSLGLGIVVTGTAFAYGLKHLLGQREFAAMGYLFLNLTQLTGWVIWCRAFWPARKVPAIGQSRKPAALRGSL